MRPPTRELDDERLAPPPAGLLDLLERAAERHASRPALRVRRGDRDREWSHAELLEAVLRAAARLRARGVEDGDRIVLQAANGPEWPIACLGILAAGGVAVPLDSQTEPRRREAVLSLTQARLAVLDEELAPPPEPGEPARVSPSELAAAGAAPPLDGLPRRRGGEDPASILFTSGTTLAPKGVVLPHRAFVANVEAVVRTLKPQARDRLVSVLPLHHAFEFTAGLLAPLSQGACITYLESLSASELVATLRRTRATALLGVPRLFELLLEGIRRGVEDSPAPIRWLLRTAWSLSREARRSGRDWGRLLMAPVRARFGGRLRFLVSGGAALDPEVQAEFAALGFRLLEGYGLTETAPVLSVNPLDRQVPGTVGPALPGVELRIDDPDEEGVGEIVARGANLMSGYYRDPEATRAVLREGWFRTGDLGRLDEDGFLRVTGRLKDLIVTPSGKNVHPDEVEAALKNLSGAKELCIVGAPARGGSGEEVVLVVVPERDDEAARQDLREAVGRATAALPTHQRVQRIVFRSEELPRTRLQKVQRNRVREQLSAPERRTDAGPPADDGGDPRRAGILDRLSELTGVERGELRLSQDLALDLGVDSLMAAELLACVGREPGSEALPPAATVGQLLDLVGGSAVEASAAGADASSARPEPVPGPLVRASAALAAGLLRALAPVLYRGWLRLEAEGLERVPEGGAVLFAANHSSHLDAGCVLLALGDRARTLRVVAARDYFFDRPFKAAFFRRLLRALPFDRHGNWASGLADCRAAVRDGASLLIFPEGTRSLDGRLQAFRPGVGRLACETGLPIVPVRIDGAHEALPKGGRFPRRGRLRVRFGAPIAPDPAEDDADHETWRRLTRKVREAIAERGPEAT